MASDVRQVAAGWYHTVLLRGDGAAVAVGWNHFGQCNLPEPPAGVVYTQAIQGDVTYPG